VERARMLGFEPASPNASANGAAADGQYGYLASPT
jgi:hypothetical protein